MKRLGVCVLCVLVVAGCSKKKESASHGNRLAEKMAEAAIEHQSGGQAKVDIQGDHVSIQTKDGNYQVSSGDAGVAIPADFPKEIPIYAGSTVVQTVTTPDGAHAMLKSTDAATKVMAFYKERLTGDGWKTEMAMQSAGGDMLSVTKGPLSLAILVSASDGTTMISATLGKN